MTVRPDSHILTRQAIEIAYRRAIDAYTVEDALRYHDELLDLLALEAMIVRRSKQREADKEDAIAEIRACAAEHRDAVDRLTDILETKRHLIWRP